MLDVSGLKERMPSSFAGLLGFAGLKLFEPGALNSLLAGVFVPGFGLLKRSPEGMLDAGGVYAGADPPPGSPAAGVRGVPPLGPRSMLLAGAGVDQLLAGFVLFGGVLPGIELGRFPPNVPVLAGGVVARSKPSPSGFRDGAAGVGCGPAGRLLSGVGVMFDPDDVPAQFAQLPPLHPDPPQLLHPLPPQLLHPLQPPAHPSQQPVPHPQS